MCLHVLPDQHLEQFPKSHVVYSTWVIYKTNQTHRLRPGYRNTCYISSAMEIIQAGKQLHVTYEIN